MREVPISREQAFENEMESRKGVIGLKDMLNSKDDSGTTLFQNLLQTADNAPKKSADYLARFISER